MFRQLPTVKYKGKMYYVDSQLEQLRNVNNPHDFIPMEDYINSLALASKRRMKAKQKRGKK